MRLWGGRPPSVGEQVLLLLLAGGRCGSQLGVRIRGEGQGSASALPECALMMTLPRGTSREPRQRRVRRSTAATTTTRRRPAHGSTTKNEGCFGEINSGEQEEFRIEPGRRWWGLSI